MTESNDEEIPNTEFLMSRGFTFSRKLGKGSTGTTWTVDVAQPTPHQLACKVTQSPQCLSQNTNPSPQDCIKQLKDRANILRSLRHTNIVLMETVIHMKDQLKGDKRSLLECIVCYEFVEICDGNLMDFYVFDRKRRIQSSDHIYNWFTEIAEAIKYLHDRNICHLDIKPTNILYKRDANKVMFKLTDFGFAIIFGPNQKPIFTGLSGTARFMAPEILNNSGKQRYNAKAADIYSFGMSSADMLGRLGYKLGKVVQPWHRLMRDDRKRIRNDRKLVDLLTRMTEEDPHARIKINDVIGHWWITKGPFYSPVP